MTKTKLEKQIFIDEVQKNNYISGYLLLKSSETITIDSLKGVVFIETRGRMSGAKNKVLSFQILANKQIVKNELYSIPFSFDSTYFKISTYHGENVSISYNLEMHIDLISEDIEKLDRSLFSKLKSYVTSDYTIKTSTYFEVEKSNLNYQVIEEKAVFKLQPNFLIIFLLLLLYGIVYFLIIPELNVLYGIIGFITAALLVYLKMKYIGNTLGVVSMETLNGEQSFICNIIKTSKFTLSKPIVYYEVIEKVIDRRGTSSTVYEESLYTSEAQRLSKIKMHSSLRFTFPNRIGLHSIDYNDVAIYWKMNLKGEYLGFTLKYHCVFKVVI